MTGSLVREPVKRARQCITRTACEPCRDKRAKCDGKKPCGRCEARSLDCHYTQRTWASKRSLQYETASLREKVNRRECVLDAISAPDCSGEDVVSMLREGHVSYDDMCDKILGDNVSGIRIDTAMGHDTRHNGFERCDRATSSPPSTTNINMMLSASGLSPFSRDHALSDEAMSLASSISEQPPPQHQQQSDLLQQQMAPMQSIPWASGVDVDSSDDVLDGINHMPPLSSGVTWDSPSVIDPILWRPDIFSSELDQLFANSWQGRLGDISDLSKPDTVFRCMG